MIATYLGHFVFNLADQRLLGHYSVISVCDRHQRGDEINEPER